MKWCLPYENGRSTKRNCFGKPGIYFVREVETKEVVYIGMSQSNCWKALYRHFQQWSDRVSRVVYQNRERYEIRVIVCTSFQAYK